MVLGSKVTKLVWALYTYHGGIIPTVTGSKESPLAPSLSRSASHRILTWAFSTFFGKSPSPIRIITRGFDSWSSKISSSTSWANLTSAIMAVGECFSTTTESNESFEMVKEVIAWDASARSESRKAELQRLEVCGRRYSWRWLTKPIGQQERTWFVRAQSSYSHEAGCQSRYSWHQLFVRTLRTINYQNIQFGRHAIITDFVPIKSASISEINLDQITDSLNGVVRSKGELSVIR